MQLLGTGKRILVEAHLQAFLTFRATWRWNGHCHSLETTHGTYRLGPGVHEFFQKSLSHIQFLGARTRCKSYNKNIQMLGVTVQSFIVRVSNPGYDHICRSTVKHNLYLLRVVYKSVNNYMFRPLYWPSSGCTVTCYKANHSTYSVTVVWRDLVHI